MADRTRRPGELPPLPAAQENAAPFPPAPSSQPVAAAATKLDAKNGGLSAPPAATDPMIGTTIGDRYRIVERIGTGGMAIVYRAEHELLKKSLAVKLLLPELAVDGDMVARFEREAVAAARLDHPNCVAITDFGRTSNGRLFLVMEFIDGKPLSDVSGYGKRLPWEHAVEITRQILRGLGRAHETGIVHRDLKASNIMLVQKDGGREIAKIIDFGIAKIFDGSTVGPRVETQAGIVFGTADFLAPERLLGKGDMDPRSDLYSVGIILYEMCTGTRPFHTDDPYMIVKRALAEQPKPPREVCPEAEIPEALESAILKALEKDPANRHASARDFLNALDPLGKRAGSTTGYLAGGASSQQPPASAAPAPFASTTPIQSEPRRRQKMSYGLWAVVVTVPIVVITLVIVLAVTGGDGKSSGAEVKSPMSLLGGKPAAPSATGVTDADVAKQIKLAGEGATVEDRQRAFDRLEAWGYVDKVPWVAKLSRDLAQLPTCEQRKEVVTALRKLNDPRALPALEAADQRADNGCLKPAAEAAIAALGGTPVAQPPAQPPANPGTHEAPPPKKSGGGGHF